MSVVIPPIVTFDNGELNDGKKLAVKILEEASELLYASQHQERSDMLSELADVIQTIGNFIEYASVTPEELNTAMEECLKRNVERGHIHISDDEDLLDPPLPPKNDEYRTEWDHQY